MTESRKPCLAPLAASMALALASGIGHAATFDVTSNADAGPGSLRAAIEGANAGPGPHTLDLSGISGQTILLESNLPAFADTESEIEILGNNVTLDGDGVYSCIASDLVFQQDGNDLSISDLTVQNCIGSLQSDFYFGGGIRVSLGSLELNNVTVVGNTADYGGGVWATGDLTIVDSIISGNTATINVGGVNASDSLSLVRTEITDNEAGGNAGGFRCLNAIGGCALTLEDSTVTGNSAQSEGGGGFVYAKYESQAISINNSTISANSAGYGGGLYAELDNASLVTLQNSTISANEAEAGGGLYITSTGGGSTDKSIVLNGVTLAANIATQSGGGAYLNNPDDDNSMTVLASASILQANTSGSGGDIEGPNIINQNSSRTKPSRVERAQQALRELTIAEQEALGLLPEEILAIARQRDRDAQPSGTLGQISADLSFTLLGTEPDNIPITLDSASQNVLGSDALLGPLQNNGGLTPTHLAGLGSPAIDLVPIGDAGCGSSLATDQRGEPRPFGPACDAGSVEGAPTVLPESVPVPTLNHWATGILAFGLAAMGWLGFRRRSSTQQN